MGGVGSGRKPREYPQNLVDHVRSMYEAGHTIKEIQATVKGTKVQNIIRRFGIDTRPAVKRNQYGENNDSWRGDDATYTAFHFRVQVARGRPQHCAACRDTSPGRYEWANLTGRYDDINDYQRMCVPCHRQFDAKRRNETGRRTSPVRR